MRTVLTTIAALIVALLAINLLTSGSEPVRAAPDPDRHFTTRPDLRPPVLTAARGAQPTAPGLVFVAPKRRDGPSGPAILDDNGDYVWFRPMPKGTLADDLRVQTYKGQPVLTWWEGRTNPRGYGQGTWVIADTSYRELARVHAVGPVGGDLHDLELTDEGTALVPIYKAVPYDLTPIGSYRDGEALDSVIQEIDVETGRVVWEWSSLEHVPITESRAGIPRKTRFPYDYFHINSIDVDTDGNLLVSARNTWAIYKLDRKSGEVIWRLGGYGSDFALGEGVRFAWQHDARRQPDGTLTLFDNQATPKVGPRSRALTLALDEDTMRATAAKIIEHPDGILSIAQGNSQVLPGGNTFVGFGSGRRVSEFDARGRLLFDIRFPAGVDSYRGYRFDWRGEPAEPPVAVATRHDGGLRVATSWNGATQVSEWEVLAGASPDALVPVAKAHRNGFETTIPIERDAAYVAVRALEHGDELGRSAPSRVAPCASC